MKKTCELIPSDTMNSCCEHVATGIFDELDKKFFNSGVYKKIAVRSLAHIRKRYGVGPKTA